MPFPEESMTTAVLGAVVSLWRYPVKSMMGEELNAADVTERGLAGDRAYALVDSSDGKVASAKNPRKWPNLFDCRASFPEPVHRGGVPPVRITLPDGRTVTSTDSDANQALSAVVGRPVTLATSAPQGVQFEEYWPDIDGLAFRETVTDLPLAFGAPHGTFFDYAPIHLLTTATLDRLRDLYSTGRFEVRRFRPNIVVTLESGEKDFVEFRWVGKTLAIGSEVQLQIVAPCPRCVMTTLMQGDLPYDSGILRTIALHTPRMPFASFGEFTANVGVYAKVLRGGTIRRRERVTVD